MKLKRSRKVLAKTSKKNPVGLSHSTIMSILEENDKIAARIMATSAYCSRVEKIANEFRFSQDNKLVDLTGDVPEITENPFGSPHIQDEETYPDPLMLLPLSAEKLSPASHEKIPHIVSSPDFFDQPLKDLFDQFVEELFAEDTAVRALAF